MSLRQALNRARRESVILIALLARHVRISREKNGCYGRPVQLSTPTCVPRVCLPVTMDLRWRRVKSALEYLPLRPPVGEVEEQAAATKRAARSEGQGESRSPVPTCLRPPGRSSTTFRLCEGKSSPAEQPDGATWRRVRANNGRKGEGKRSRPRLAYGPDRPGRVAPGQSALCGVILP